MSTAHLDVAAANNFMAVEDDLVALLRDAVRMCRPAVHVLTAAQLTNVTQARQLVPALHVIYGGPYRIAESQGMRLLLDHTWHVVVVDTHVGSTRTGQQARAEVGPLVALAMNALAGASIARATRPLELADPPAPWFEAGTQYFPVSVKLQTIFHKLPLQPEGAEHGRI